MKSTCRRSGHRRPAEVGSSVWGRSLAHMRGTGARALLAANGNAARVEQVAEELPAGRRLAHSDSALGGNPVGRAAGGHRRRDTGLPSAIPGGQVRIGGQDREAVRRRHVRRAADDQVAITIAVECGPQVGTGQRSRRRRRCRPPPPRIGALPAQDGSTASAACASSRFRAAAGTPSLACAGRRCQRAGR